MGSGEMRKMGVCGGLVGGAIEIGDEEKTVMALLCVVGVDMVEGGKEGVNEGSVERREGCGGDLEGAVEEGLGCLGGAGS